MKKMFVLLAVVLALTGCELAVSVDGTLDRVSVSEATFVTEYEYQGGSVVCDDETTNFDVEIEFNGSPTHITLYLEGAGGNTAARETFELTGDEISRGRFEETLRVYRQSAPLLLNMVTTGVMPAITVSPRPVIIGYTRLVAVLEGNLNSDAARSNLVPVLRSCDQ